MKPIEFEGCNVVYAKDQPEYQPLPAMKTKEGEVLTCWELTPEERLQVFNEGKIYINMLTFNQPLQPILPFVKPTDE